MNTPRTLSRRALLSAGAAEFGAPALRARLRRPNVVLILPDQLRAQALGCMGDPNVSTPNIDRLASQGVTFQNTIANSPVCCPARAILMTGQYCHKNGMVANDLRLRESSTTLPEVLAREGYRTGFVGKWHLDGGKRLPGFVPPGPRRQGFEFWAANECSHTHFRTQYFRDRNVPVPMEKFEAEGWTDLGIEFLEKTRTDKRPFFLCVFMGPPHDPYGAPDAFMKRYSPESLKLRPNWREAPHAPGRKDIAAYYAAVSAVDEQVGRLVGTVDRLGLAEDTVVMLSSDHGDMLGSHGERLKRKPWEESIRVPGIVRYPRRVKSGRRDNLLLSHVDLMPTLLRICGAPVPEGVQGADLSAAVLTGNGPSPESSFLQIFGPYDGDGTTAGWRGVRTSRYTYARFEDRPWLLYDNETDPYQTENLVSHQSARPLLAKLDETVTHWMNKIADSWSYDWHEKVEDKGRLYKHRTFYSVNEYLAWAANHPEVDN